jgi:uncharacterized lipoprotein YehR (DUF1307 family)
VEKRDTGIVQAGKEGYMVKKFKSYFVLFVALCLMMALVACGSSKSQESKDTVVQQPDVDGNE